MSFPPTESGLAPPAPSGGAALAPVFGRWTAMWLVLGAMVGSGVFLKASSVATSTHGHVGLILLLWAACGVVNLCGALTLAELATLMPHAGGTFVYLREAYGRRWAFLWGWSELLVIRSGAVAALAIGVTISLEFLLADLLGWSFNPLRQCALATATILFLMVVNVLGASISGGLQNVTAWAKLGFLLVIASLPLWPAPAAAASVTVDWSLGLDDSAVWLGMGTALSGIMWAYDGWGNLGVVAEEVRDPKRSIPWALVVGVTLVMALYLAANLAYHLMLPWQTVAAGPVPAASAIELVWPQWGPRFINLVLMISTFGALHANVLTGPRVLFAMSRDKLFFSPFREVHPRFGTPATAIVGLSAWSAALIWLSYAAQSYAASGASVPMGIHLPGKKPLYDVLTDYCIFGGSVFYLTAVLAVFVLRRRRPEWERPYRAWGYPYTPLAFVASYVLLLGWMMLSNPWESCSALGFVAVGCLVYELRFRRSALPTTAPAPQAE